MTREGLTEAIRLADRALELEPRYGLAAALAAQCHLLNVSLGYAVKPQLEGEEATRLVRLALSEDENDPDALGVAGAVAGFLSGNYEGAIDLVDRAVALNPNSAFAWIQRGWTYKLSGQPEEAIQSFERAIRVSPLDPAPLRDICWNGDGFHRASSVCRRRRPGEESPSSEPILFGGLSVSRVRTRPSRT